MIISRARKVQAIADLLSGQEAGLGVGDLDPPWSRYYQWIEQWIDGDQATVDWDELAQEFYQYCLVYSEQTELDRENYHLIIAAKHNPVHYRPVDELRGEWPDLEWLWEGWIPLGLLTVFAATPGTGKSYVVLDLAQRIISDDEFPNGSGIRETGKVLYVDAENAPSILKERTQVWERRNLRLLYSMMPAAERMVINLDDFVDRDRLLDMVCVVKPVLVAIDSYGSATLRGERNKEDVQELLAFLNKIAVDHRLAMVLVHHLRKRAGDQVSFVPVTLDSVRGSSHIVAMARNVLALQLIPTREEVDPNGPRKLWVMKSNIGPHPEPIGVFFGPHPQYPDVAQIRYGEAPRPYREPTKVDTCAAWLLQLLQESNEPLSPGEVVEIGQMEGFSRATIFRARDGMEAMVVNTAGRKSPNNKWTLATEEGGG